MEVLVSALSDRGGLTVIGSFLHGVGHCQEVSDPGVVWPDGSSNNNSGSDTNDDIDKPCPGQSKVREAFVESEIREK